MYLFIMYKRSTTYRQYDARKQIRIIIFVLPCFYVPVIVLVLPVNYNYICFFRSWILDHWTMFTSSAPAVTLEDEQAERKALTEEERQRIYEEVYGCEEEIKDHAFSCFGKPWTQFRQHKNRPTSKHGNEPVGFLRCEKMQRVSSGPPTFSIVLVLEYRDKTKLTPQPSRLENLGCH